MGLILEIAAGVAAGIVLAYLLIIFWQQALKGALIITVVAAVICVIGAGLYFFYSTYHFQSVEAFVFKLVGLSAEALLFVLIALGVLCLINTILPVFKGSLFNGVLLLFIPVCAVLTVYILNAQTQKVDVKEVIWDELGAIIWIIIILGIIEYFKKPRNTAPPK